MYAVLHEHGTPIVKEKIYKEEIRPLLDLKYHLMIRSNPVIKFNISQNKITVEYDPITDRLLKDLDKQIERIWLRHSADAVFTLAGIING